MQPFQPWTYGLHRHPTRTASTTLTLTLHSTVYNGQESTYCLASVGTTDSASSTLSSSVLHSITQPIQSSSNTG